MSNNISKALKNKTDAQLRLLEQDAAPIVRESASGDNFIADPNEYSQGLLAGKNITITISGNNKTINAVMGILAGDNISISEADEDGKVTIKGTLSGKEINILDFTGKDGYVLSYDETGDQFILTEVSSGGGLLTQATESELGGIKAKARTTEASEVAIDTATGKLFAPAPDQAENGIPAGGASGQILSKTDGQDFNAQWIDPPSGGGSSSDYYALFSNGSLTSGRTERGVTTKFLSASSKKIKGISYMTNWILGVEFTCKLWSSALIVLASKSLIGDGTSMTRKNIFFDIPISLIPLSEYFISIERPSGTITKIYGSKLPNAFVTELIAYSGVPLEALNPTTNDNYNTGVILEI